MEFKSVNVTPANVVGDVTTAADIVSDYLTTNRTFHGAAVIGFLKKICGNFSLLKGFIQNSFS